MKQGTILEAIVIDPAGLVSLRAGALRYRGVLLHSLTAVEPGQQLRLRVELEHLAGEPPSFDVTMSVRGRVVAGPEAGLDSGRLELSVGTRFGIEVLQFTRGFLWDEPSLEALPSLAAPAGTAPAQLLDAVSIVTRDADGTLELSCEGRQFQARLLRVPERLSLGDELHIRASVTSQALVSGTENVDLLGRVAHIDDDYEVADGVAYRPGLRFDFAIVRYTGSTVPFPTVAEEALNALLPESAWDSGITDISPLPLAVGVSVTDDAPDALPEPVVRPEEDDAVPSGFEPSGIIGSLRQMSLVDLLQSLELNRKTCRVDVPGRDRGSSGALFLRRGELVAASMGALRGEDAFFALIAIDQGTFQVHFGRDAEQRNISRSTTYLLLEAMRRFDEGARPQLALVEEPADPFVDKTEETPAYVVDTDDGRQPSNVVRLPGPVDNGASDVVAPPPPQGSAPPPLPQRSAPPPLPQRGAPATPSRTPPPLPRPEPSSLPTRAQPPRPGSALQPPPRRRPVFAGFFDEVRKAEAPPEPKRRPHPFYGESFTPSFAVPVVTLEELEQVFAAGSLFDPMQGGWPDANSVPPTVH